MVKRPLALFFLLGFWLTHVALPAIASELVTRVLDGDTFELVTGEKVRITGIDAPEDDPSSTAHLSNLIENKLVTLEFEGERTDKYGRTLAFVRLADSTDVGAKMVGDGHALVYVKYPCSRTDAYLKLELAAREAGRGLWAGHVRTDRAPPATELSPVFDVRPYLESSIPQTGSGSAEVYVTRTGTKYHRAGCKYLSKSMIPIALEEAVARYGPCSQCVPPTMPSQPAPKEPTTQPEGQGSATNYWINSGSNTRHNSSCRWYGTTKKGHYTTERIGKACGTCGG